MPFVVFSSKMRVEKFWWENIVKINGNAQMIHGIGIFTYIQSIGFLVNLDKLSTYNIALAFMETVDLLTVCNEIRSNHFSN